MLLICLVFFNLLFAPTAREILGNETIDRLKSQGYDNLYIHSLAKSIYESNYQPPEMKITDEQRAEYKTQRSKMNRYELIGALIILIGIVLISIFILLLVFEKTRMKTVFVAYYFLMFLILSALIGNLYGISNIAGFVGANIWFLLAAFNRFSIDNIVRSVFLVAILAFFGVYSRADGAMDDLAWLSLVVTMLQNIIVLFATTFFTIQTVKQLKVWIGELEQNEPQKV